MRRSGPLSDRLYNVFETGDPTRICCRTWQTQFRNGVVVDVESQHPGLVITEVMWGEDVSLNPSSNSQYIELYNPGGDRIPTRRR